ncbi:MAG: universal stress protein [Verrucomicrobiales bacterium]
MDASPPIKRILNPLDLSPFSAAATRTACAIAKQHGATVEGLVVLDFPGITGQDVPYHAWMLPDALLQSAERIADAKPRISNALQQFSVTCDAAGVSHVDSTHQGVPADRIMETASLHDLVVMGLRTFFHFETSDDPGDTLAKVLHAPQTPILAVTENCTGDWKRVLIAFDGSPAACRVLKEFSRFARPCNIDITLLTSADDQEQGARCVESAAAYLRAHQFDNIKTSVSESPILEVLDDLYLKSFDLVVAGSHSRKYLKDFFVGSVARRLIDFGQTPVFIN